jgi:hypothetical protein
VQNFQPDGRLTGDDVCIVERVDKDGVLRVSYSMAFL